MSERFTVDIAVGNSGMQTPDHLAAALCRVAKSVLEGRDFGRILDENGNTVGEYDWKNES